MRIRVVREAGGLGDLVRLFSVFQGLRLLYGPGAELHYYGLDHYRPLFRPGGPCRDVDQFFAVPFSVTFRRPRMAPLEPFQWPYLDRGLDYDRSIDEFCPAYVWGEVETDGRVIEDRARIWCRAAGVPFTYPVWHVSERAAESAEGWYVQRGLEPSRTIALQPFGTTRTRDWPKEKWAEFAGRMLADGWQVLILDVCLRAAGIPGILEHRLKYEALGAVLARARLAVTGDSGLFHVAAAVGTPVLGLFGHTSGEIMCQSYPPGVAHFIQGVNGTLPCAVPCYGRKSRGWVLKCRDGCKVLDEISVDAVHERASGLLGGHHHG